MLKSFNTHNFSNKALALFVFLPSIASAQMFGGIPETDKNQNNDSFIEEQNTNQPAVSNESIKIFQVTNQKKDEQKKPEIQLSMGNFSVSKGLNGILSCSMRFYVRSTVPERISNVSYRLKWPKMETPLSFDGVEAGTVLYRDYTLLGNGCYSMDVAPNIIVNRCRIKGMSQQECADLIRWVK